MQGESGAQGVEGEDVGEEELVETHTQPQEVRREEGQTSARPKIIQCKYKGLVSIQKK